MQIDSLKFKVFLFLVFFSLLIMFGGAKNSDNPKLNAENVVKKTGPGALATATPIIASTSISEAGANNIITEDKTIPVYVDIEETKYYKVVKIVDGDTIDADINGQVERVRLLGINTPEVVDPRKPVECFGREASAKAREWLSGEEVTLESDASQDNRDKYGRLLRYVKIRTGFFYNLEIIKQGYAYEYTYNLPYKYQKEFKAAQKFAQGNKLGLWADNSCGVKNIAEGGALSQTASTAECIIKGNINSKKEKIYHLENCPYYKNTVIDESLGEKWFCSEEEAVKAGWRKAKNCP